MAFHAQKKITMPKSKPYVSLECAVWANGKDDFHREDGPAVEYSDGFKAWYLNDEEYSEEDYNDKIKTLR